MKPSADASAVSVDEPDTDASIDHIPKIDELNCPDPLRADAMFANIFAAAFVISPDPDKFAAAAIVP
jgi:hypothetical protein